MAEKECGIEVYGMEYACDRCGRGTMMRSTDISPTESFPPLYTHYCNSCGVIAKLKSEYPKILYRILSKN